MWWLAITLLPLSCRCIRLTRQQRVVAIDSVRPLLQNFLSDCRVICIRKYRLTYMIGYWRWSRFESPLSVNLSHRQSGPSHTVGACRRNL
ncbi:hypothetical protein EJ02DRAFT_93815 [Clathrospora elynae]|uniref:Secreted protein n=1 Tax=Clathrospora elynae TaxID=706981 RepID=A0A6A5SVG9_9PLEO|nr:hypothetical protein EJ02DRAFT_93815 [Clathrospora elynae]